MKNLPKDSEIITSVEKLTVFDVIESFMKKHGETMIRFLLCFIFISSTAFAHEATDKKEPVPKYFKDSTIIRTLKNGTTQRFSSNNFKIVPRVKMKKVSCPVCLCPVCPQPRPPKKETKKNKILLGVGMAQDGLRVYEGVYYTSVERDFSPVSTIGYERQLTDEVSFTGQVIFGQVLRYNVRDSVIGGLGSVGYSF